MRVKDLLTSDELKAIEVAGEFYALCRDKIFGKGECFDADMIEVQQLVHALQNIAASQAAARGWPGQYRLKGLNMEETMRELGEQTKDASKLVSKAANSIGFVLATMDIVVESDAALTIAQRLADQGLLSSP